MTRLMHVQSKIDLLAAREYFFSSIIKALTMEPLTMDVLFGSDADYAPPRLLSMNVEFGSLVIEVQPNFIGEGDESRYYYSILVMGDILRVGIFMPLSRILTVPVQDDGRERLIQTWNGAQFNVQDRGLGILYEWTFTDFNPANWANAEKYVLGIRYLHFRLLGLVHNTVREEIAPTLLRN
ncbi:MAG: hypothetical protein M0T86_04955 [Betaproteobacteria bacterium]|nr:hypothetical protein [Betaproteobacteria bacterium]